MSKTAADSESTENNCSTPSYNLPRAPTTLERWLPIAVWLPQYSWGKYLTADLLAALSVAALLIPESMGYATVAGLPVQIGLYAAPLALIGYAMFGGSSLLVFSVAGSVAALTGSLINQIGGGDPALAVTIGTAIALTTGLVFLIAGLLKMGWITNFMSHAVTHGFIFGMAVKIIIDQLHNLTGVETEGSNAVMKLWAWLTQIGQWGNMTTLVGISALALIFALRRFLPKIPAALTAVVLASIFVALIHPKIELVAAIPNGLPQWTLPQGLSLTMWAEILLGGMAVALVGFSEGWGASAKITEKTHDELNSNQEFVAYGVGNIGASLLGGMPAAGSLSKSSAALAAGGKTEMTSIILAGIILLTLMFLAPLFQWLPEAVLAAIVINVMWESANPTKLLKLWKFSKLICFQSFFTAFLVLTLGLLPAIVIGIVLSVLYLIYRISFPARAELGQDLETKEFVTIKWFYGQRHGLAHPQAKPIPNYLIYRFSAPLIFANAEPFLQSGKDLLIQAANQGKLPQYMIIDCEEILYIDFAGAMALRALTHYCQRYHVQVILVRVHSGARHLMELAGLLDEIGAEHIYPSIRTAIQNLPIQESSSKSETTNSIPVRLNNT